MSKFSKFFIIILTLSLLFTSSVTPAFAALPDDSGIAEPLWSNVSTTTIGFYESNGKLVAYVKVVGISGTTFINGSMAIRRTAGESIGQLKRWTDLSSSTSFFTITDNTVDAEPGEYVLKFSIVATRNGVLEQIPLEKTLTI